PGKNPVHQAPALELRCLCHHLHAPCETARLCRDRVSGIGQIRIGEDIGEVEAALAHETLGVDGQPAACSEVQHIAMMQIAMQHTDLAWFGQQYAGGLPTAGKNSTMNRSSRLQFSKP